MITIEILRMCERLVAVGFGGVSLILGFKLFTLGVPDPQKGEITLFKQIKIRALQFGPGIFFAFFGAWVLKGSLDAKIQVTQPSSPTLASSGVTNFSGLQGADRKGFDSEPADTIKAINSLERQNGDYLNTPAGLGSKEILRVHKKALLRLEWPTSSDLVDRYFEYLDRGLPIPKNEETLTHIKDSYEATLP